MLATNRGLYHNEQNRRENSRQLNPSKSYVREKLKNESRAKFEPTEKGIGGEKTSPNSFEIK